MSLLDIARRDTLLERLCCTRAGSMLWFCPQCLLFDVTEQYRCEEEINGAIVELV